MVAAILVMLMQGPTAAPDLDRSFEYQCPGLDDFEIQVVSHVDSSGGTVGSKNTGHSLGIGLGVMQDEVVPRRRPPGYRWYKSEAIGQATLTYGLAVGREVVTDGQRVKRNLLQATILGSPISGVVNLAADPNEEAMLLTVARALAISHCVGRERKP